jgi:hypothetical protein
MLRLVPHCDRGPEAWSATSEAAEWALGVLEGTKSDVPYALGDDDRETKACLAAALASRAALVSFSSRSSEDAGESLEQRWRDTVRFALRAVRAAGDCPGVVQAAADALGGVRAADPESAARETRRFHEERDGEKDVSPSLSSPSPSHAPLYSSLSVLGDALRAPSRHARFAALAFLCEMSASTGECGEANVTAETISAGDTPTSLGSILHLFKDVNARDAADAAKSGVMEYAKTSQVAIASVMRAVEGDAFKPEWARWTALCALGATRLRLATLWPALIKLLGAASARAALEPAWEALFSSLEGAQRECLDAHDAATGAAKTSRGAVKTGGRRRGWIEARGEDEDEDADGDEEKNGDEDDDDGEETGRYGLGGGVARARVGCLLPRGARRRPVDAFFHLASVRCGVASSRREAPASSREAFSALRRSAGGRHASLGQSLAQRFARVAQALSKRAGRRARREGARARRRRRRPRVPRAARQRGRERFSVVRD